MPLDVVRRLLTPLREPLVTSRYPAVPPLLQGASHGLPEVDRLRCDRSAVCVEACPTDAITLQETGWAIDAGRCVFCSACALACPTDAIRMGSEVELAGRDRASLVSVTPLEARR